MILLSSFLHLGVLFLMATQSPMTPSDEARMAVETAHTEIWERFVDEHDVLLDFTDLDGSVMIPTPEECLAGKPNALGWWGPIENGAMFNGMYLDGMVNRALQTGNAADQAKARRLAEGLLRLADCSELDGFIGRGFATDGQTSYPMGSNDQTGPWFYGLWRYLESGLGDADIQNRIRLKFEEVANILAQTPLPYWLMPAEEPFTWRGSFRQFSWGGAPRLLFVCKAMHRMTGDSVWAERYNTFLLEGNPTRLAICEQGLEEGEQIWTGASSAIALRGLWEMEEDPVLKEAFARGLRATANAAAAGMSARSDFSNEDTSTFEHNWRVMNEIWVQQNTVQDATDLASAQLSLIKQRSPRRTKELTSVRTAAFASWVVTLSPDEPTVELRAEILETLAYFQTDKLFCVSFFPLESAWWRLQTLD
jgi:hypothetical protein